MKKKTVSYLSIVLLFIVLGVSFTTPASAQIFRRNVAELLRDANRVFSGKCTSVRTELDTTLNKPVTIATFSVTKKIKGEMGDTVVIRQFGGKVKGGFPLMLSGMPSYKVGEEVILFLHGESRYGLSSPVGLLQGKFLVTKDKKTGRKVAINGLKNANLFERLRTEDFSLLRVFSTKELDLLKVKEGPVEYDIFVSFLNRTFANLSKISIEDK